MTGIHTERMSAKLEGDFVVLLIGMRINKVWKFHQWVPVALAMRNMLKELSATPELGLLHYELGTKTIVQYWRSFEHLENYARGAEQQHLPAWKAFNQRIKGARGDVGIWHETYKIGAGQYEAVYSGMPAFGLGAAGELLPATGKRESARGRIDEAT